MKTLKSYKCSIDGESWTTINATSRGSAKAKFFRSYDMDIKYTWISCKSNGMPYTSDDFKRNARYRQIEFAFVGMAVKVGDWDGVIVGHNSSANLDVLFTSGPSKGRVGNCHPHWKICYYDSNGSIIKSYQ